MGFSLGFLPEQALEQEQKEETWDDVYDPLTPTTSSQSPRYIPHCRWAPVADLDPDTLTFPGGAALQLHTVPPGLLPRIPIFFICTGCGKVFWEGSHFGRVLSQFQEVLHISEDDITPGLPNSEKRLNL